MSRAPRVLLLLSPALLFALATNARAQEPKQPTLDVRGPGKSGLVGKPRRFLQVPILVENPLPTELRGTLKVYRSSDARTPTPAQHVFYERPIALPSGGKRIESIYYFCQAREPENRLCVELVPSSGAAVHIFPKLEMKSSSVLVLSLTSALGDPGDVFQGLHVDGPRETYDVVERKADVNALPDRPCGYDAWDAVVACDLDPDQLKGARRGALFDWVALGGELVVVFSGKGTEPLDPKVMPVHAAKEGEPIAARDLSALAELAPDVDPPDLAKVSVRRVELEKDSELIAGTPEQPLVARRRYGAGHVTYVAFPLTAPSLDLWRGRRALLELLVRPPREDLEVEPPDPPLEEVLQCVSSCIHEIDPPSALLVGPLLIIYVLLVAPLNYIVLSRLGRREISFGTAGLLAVAFVAVFYGIGWLYKGSQALIARAAVIELASRPGEPSRVETMTGFFSTDIGLVDASAPAGSAISVVAERDKGRAARVVEPQDGPFQLKAIELATWSLRRFRCERLEDLGSLEAGLDFQDELMVHGYVKNSTKLKLAKATIFTAGGVVALGDLEPGELRQVSSAPQGGDAPKAFAQAFLQGLDEKPWKALAPDSGLPMAQTWGFPQYQPSEPRARIVAQIRRRLAAVDAGRNGVPALVVAISDDDVGGVELGAKAKREVARGLVVAETLIRVDGAESRKTARIVGLPARVTGERAWNPQTGSLRLDDSNPQNILSGVVELEWRLPASGALPCRASELEIRYELFAPSGEHFKVELYDWQRALQREEKTGWVARASSEERREDTGNLRKIRIPAQSAARFLDPASGRLRARIVHDGPGAADVYVGRVVLDATISR